METIEIIWDYIWEGELELNLEEFKIRKFNGGWMKFKEENEYLRMGIGKNYWDVSISIEVFYLNRNIKNNVRYMVRYIVNA